MSILLPSNGHPEADHVGAQDLDSALALCAPRNDMEKI